MGRLALGRGLERAGVLGLQFGQQLTQSKKDKKKEEEEARARGISEELSKERLLNVQEQRAERQTTREEKVIDKKKLKEFTEFINTPIGERIIGDAFKQAQANQDPKPIQGQIQKRAPTRPEQLERIRGSEFEISQQEPIKEFRTGLEKEELAGVTAQAKTTEQQRKETQKAEEFTRQEAIKQQGKRELESIRAQVKKDILQNKPFERKSTTKSAQIVSDSGFALNNYKILRKLIAEGDVSIFETTGLLGFGEFSNPELANSIEQLTEVHGRAQSGAAISGSEWGNFRKQILNRKFLLTKAGQKEALENIDRFIGRTFAKAEEVTNDPKWLDVYNESAQRGVTALGGGPSGKKVGRFEIISEEE